MARNERSRAPSGKDDHELSCELRSWYCSFRSAIALCKARFASASTKPWACRMASEMTKTLEAATQATARNADRSWSCRRRFCKRALIATVDQRAQELPPAQYFR